MAVRVSGAGGGGFMFFTIDPTKRINLINTLNQFNGKVFNFHFSDNGCQGWKINENRKAIHMQTEIINQIKASIALKMKVLDQQSLLSDIEEATKSNFRGIQKTNTKYFLPGNGGSAADSQHIAAELGESFYFDTSRLPAVASHNGYPPF